MWLKRVYCEYKRYKNNDWGSYWNFKHGFLRSTINFCGITKGNYKGFVSDEDFRKGHPYNRAFSGIIDNKVYLPYLFRDFSTYIPVIYYFKDEFGFLPLDGASSGRVQIESFIDLLNKEKKLVLKHTYSEVGRGFYLLEYDEEASVYYVNKKSYTQSQVESLVFSLKDYIVESYVYQHQAISRIAPNSLNTLRMLLVWSSKLNSFVVARCFQRFGCNGNIVDNVGSGNGLLVYVNEETGVYAGEGVINSNGGVKS